MRSIRLLIVDPEQARRESIRACVETRGREFEVVGQGRDIVSVLHSTRKTDPIDILIINIDRPMMATPRIWAKVRTSLPGARILALTEGASIFVEAALAAGVTSLHPSTVTCGALRRALRRAYRGLVDYDHRLRQKVEESFLDSNNELLIRIGGLTIDLGSRAARMWGKRLPLSRMEFEVLAHLSQRPGQAAGIDELLRAIWGVTERSGGTKAEVKNCILRLRRKIEISPHHPQYILTDRTEGYFLQDPSLFTDSINAQRN